MADAASGELVRILERVERGDGSAAESLSTRIYEELRAVASGYLRGGGRDAIMQTTVLVHEAYVRLLGGEGRWESRAHFFAVGAKAMRQVLASHWRAEGAAKRGGGAARVSLSRAEGAPVEGVDVSAVDEALTRLEGLDERQARLVEMRFFGGMTEREIALVLGVSVATVEREWRAARAWLGTELRRGSP